MLLLSYSRLLDAGMVAMASALSVTLLAFMAPFCAAASQQHDPDDDHHSAIERLREYLRFSTVHPNPNYGPALHFLLAQAQSLTLHASVTEYVPSKPVLLLTWKGKEPSLPSILLNSHMDVVPAESEHWKYPPFEAFMDDDGNVYGRGAQDMKSTGMMYLEAVRNLQKQGFLPLRNVHISFVPDEEIGGADGFERFSKSEDFRDLNVGVGLDEGAVAETPVYRAFAGEKSPWWLSIKAVGAPGHGSKLFENSAIENILKSMAAITAFRTAEFNKIKLGKADLSDVISVNPVFLKAGTPTPTGFVMNLQPSEAEAGFDVRVPPSADRQALEKRITEEWAPSFRNMTYKFVLKAGSGGNASAVSAELSKPWWGLLEVAVAKAGAEFSTPEIICGTTDARFVRDQGIPALGFSPIGNTVPLLHDHNEYLNVNEFLKGIKVYEEILRTFASFEGVGNCAEAANSPDLLQFV